MKNLGSIMKQAQKIQAQIAIEVQEELAQKTVEASAGVGMITVVANGKQEIVSIRIEPEVLQLLGKNLNLWNISIPILENQITLYP